MEGRQINELFGISESFMLPDRLMTLLFSEEINDIFEKYTDIQCDLSYDGFTNYFQEEHSSRKAMMQDFTPKEVAGLVGMIGAMENAESCLDICAGTGGLSIGLWSRMPDITFFCEELSQRALPILLFNLAVRNISGYVSNKNVLTGEVIQHYRLTPGERFSKIERIGNIPQTPVDVCISNPPYSLKWEHDDKQQDIRFSEYGYPPKQYSDLAFIILGLSRLKDNGRLAAILPHGVLFRGNKEAEIRRKMIENGIIGAVIGLPDKLFLNTDIPVAVIVFEKSENKSILFIDASQNFEKISKLNRLRSTDIEKIFYTLKSRLEIKKYSHIAQMKEISENEFNLNISRYVDTYQPPPPIDIIAVTKELCDIERKKSELEKEIYESIKQLAGNDEKTKAELKTVLEMLGKMCDIK